MTITNTNRLNIRTFELTDSPFILELLNSPGWLQYIDDRGIKNLTDAEDYLLIGPMKSHAEKGFGLYMVELAETNTPIGMCGLIKRDSLEHIDLGFAFLPEHIGKGYAFEASEAILQYAKDLGHNRVLAITLPANTSSITLLSKLGFEYEKPLVMNNETLSLYNLNL